jgi:hypothetical protein
MAEKEGRSRNRYTKIIERIFFKRYKPGMTEVPFTRDEIVKAASEIGISLPKNIGDLVYSFRYRSRFPQSIIECAPHDRSWIIRPHGAARYLFALTAISRVVPTLGRSETKIPEGTPGIIAKYALSDEQALLAKLRYNRLIDIFTGVTCYSLQSHLRTFVSNMGQVETDEIYIGVNRCGAHYVFPVQAKGGANDQVGIVQIEQDLALCKAKFPALICRPIAAQFMADNLIALFMFEESKNGLVVAQEKHYRLVPPDQMTEKDLEDYRNRTGEQNLA